MTTIELNNQNKTKVNFSYDNGLPYKKSIRPEIEYGDWTTNPKITLIKINLEQHDLDLIKNQTKISILKLYTIENELWLDIDDIYIVMPLDKLLKQNVENNNIIVAFLHNNNLINALGFQ